MPGSTDASNHTSFLDDMKRETGMTPHIWSTNISELGPQKFLETALQTQLGRFAEWAKRNKLSWVTDATNALRMTDITDSKSDVYTKWDQTMLCAIRLNRNFGNGSNPNEAASRIRSMREDVASLQQVLAQFANTADDVATGDVVWSLLDNVPVCPEDVWYSSGCRDWTDVADQKAEAFSMLSRQAETAEQLEGQVSATTLALHDVLFTYLMGSHGPQSIKNLTPNPADTSTSDTEGVAGPQWSPQ